jgi:hypothetical protein
VPLMGLPYLQCVVGIDHHRIRDSARTPCITPDAGMSIFVRPFVLLLPIVEAISPAVLLEGSRIRGIPEMHSHISRVYCRIGAIRSYSRFNLLIIRIAVKTAIPASLHTNRIRIHSREIQFIHWAILPDIRDITVRLLAYVVLCIDVEDVPLNIHYCLI